MRSIALVALTTLFAVIPAMAGAAAPPRDAPLASRVRAYLQPYVDLDVFSGVVLIARGENVLMAEPFGKANRELGVANDVHQRFRIASISKAFTAVAIGTLIDAGKLGLDTRLAKFLPGYPRAGQITIDELLTHRAGIPNDNSLPYDEEAIKQNDLDALVAKLESEPLTFDPGTKRRYSNGGYALLAAVIEKVTGETYAQYLGHAVLEPMGLHHTEQEADGEVVPHRAYGYMPDASRPRVMAVAPYQQMATKTGGGSLVSTAADLHRFGLGLMTSPVLRGATWKALFHPHDGSLFFDGRCPGFNSALFRDLKDNLVIVVLSNNYASGMLADVTDALAKLARGKTPDPVELRSDVTVPASRLAVFSGRYEPPEGVLPLPPGTLIDVALVGDHLVVRVGTTPVDVLVPQSDRSFLARNLWSRLTFASDGTTMVDEPLYRPGEVTLKRVPPGS